MTQRRKGAEAQRLGENSVARIVVDAAVKVHRAFGPGLLESIYEMALAHELRSRGLEVARQVPIDVVYEGVRLGPGFRADIIVEGRLLLEIKAVEQLADVHKQQTLTYIRLADLRLALLLN